MSDQPPPNWVGDILNALAPLRALGPVHGGLPEQDAVRLKSLERIAVALETTAERMKGLAETIRGAGVSRR